MAGEDHHHAHVLLIEDDPGDALMIRESLEQAGVPVRLHRVRDGEQGLWFLGQAARSAPGFPRPKLILLDLGLPGCHGLDVLASLRADRRLRDIRVVVLTASRDPRDIRRSQQLGASAYVVKPADFDGLAGLARQIGAMLGLAGARG
jgi:CheY-like chemotaxis protein